jgi:sugar lactone lactonase YvrE
MTTTTNRTRKRIKLSSNIVEQDSATNQTKINTDASGEEEYLPNIDINASWSQMGVTVAGGTGSGSAINQLHHPWGMCMDNDQAIYIAEYSNHRIVKWKCAATNGDIVAGGNKQGNKANQLNGPANVIIDHKHDSLIICEQGNRRVMRWPCQNGKHGETIILDVDCWGLAIDRNGSLYVSDYKKHEVRRCRPGETCGIVVAGGNGKGDHLNQFNCPAYIFVDQDFSVYVSDIGNHRLVKWLEGAKEGIVIAGGEGEGKGLIHLSYPSGIAVDQLGTVYVVDSHNHRIMRWLKGATQGSIIVGGNDQGADTNQLDGPLDLSLDRQGNIYVVDNLNHRIQKFNIDS